MNESYTVHAMLLTDCGVGGDPAVFDAGAEIVERKLNAMLAFLISHRKLGTANRSLREAGSVLLAGHSLGGGDSHSLLWLRRDQSSGQVLHFCDYNYNLIDCFAQ